MKQLCDQMEQGWQFIWSRLFFPKTNLFYDYLTGQGDESLRHLPRPEEIEAQVPNPCGWGTGMEDCMLNSGSVLDVLRLREQLLGETNAGLAEKVIDGIHRCATVHGRDGFLVRGVAPDGKSCYTNSSRDQFTLAVFGLWRFLKTWTGASEQARKQAEYALVSIARYCEATITEKNHYDLLRLDGHPALVSKMWECSVHEWLRLPMIYAAAFDCTGDRHWAHAAETCAERALAESLEFNPEDSCWWDISLMQMQISLSMFREIGLFPEMESALTGLIHRVAAKSEEKLRETLHSALEYNGSWTSRNADWRTRPFLLQNEVLKITGGSAVLGGKTYLNPVYPDEYRKVFNYLRGTGNYLIACALDGDWCMPADLHDSFVSLMARQDFPNASTDGVINLLHGYWLLRRNT